MAQRIIKRIKNLTKRLLEAKQNNTRFEEGRAYGNLGKAYRNLGDFQRAIEYHEKDLSIAKDVGDWAGEGQAYYNLGISYLNLDSLNESLAHFRLSVETHNTIRGSLISKDVWKIRYRTVWTNAYTCLWQVLIMLQKDERGPLRCWGRKSTSLARRLGNKIWFPIISTQVQ